MKSYRTLRGNIKKIMCFYPHKGIPKAVVEAFVIINDKGIYAVGKVGGRVDAMNTSEETLPSFPAMAQHPIVFSLKTLRVSPSQVKNGVPSWRIEPKFFLETGYRYNYWEAINTLCNLGDVSQG